jgi:hypothetical protein
VRLIALLAATQPLHPEGILDKMTSVLYQEGRSSTPAVGDSSGSSIAACGGMLYLTMPQRLVP